MRTALDIAKEFAPERASDLERAILRHREHHMAVEREVSAKMLDEKAPMEHVTAEQIKAIIADNERKRIDHHKCGMCGYQTAYLVLDTGSVVFDAGCDCTRRSELRPASFEDVAETFNMQKPEIRARMWEDFQAGKPLID